MIILLKVILGLFLVLTGFVGRFVYQDFSNTRKSPDFDNSTLFERFVVNFMFYFLITALTALAVFFIYYIIVPIKIG